MGRSTITITPISLLLIFCLILPGKSNGRAEDQVELGGGREHCSSFTECLALANLRVRGNHGDDKRLASSLYRRATEMRPESKQAWLGLGASLQDQGDLGGAEQALAVAFSLDPLCWRVGVNLGHLSALQHNWEQSVRAFRHVIRSRPNTPHALYSLGYLRMIQGRLGDACALFSEAWTLKSDMHTLSGMQVALHGLESLRAKGHACETARPEIVKERDAGMLSGGTEWEEAYMSDTLIPCNPLELVVDATRVGNDVHAMDDLRVTVGSLHRIFGAHCDGQVRVNVVLGNVDAHTASEIAAWDLVSVKQCVVSNETSSHPEDTQMRCPDHVTRPHLASVASAAAWACDVTGGQGAAVLLHPLTRVGNEASLREALKAAERDGSGAVRVPVSDAAGACSQERQGEFSLVGVAEGCRVRQAGGVVGCVQLINGVVHRKREMTSVVILGVGNSGRDLARIIDQSRMDATLISEIGASGDDELVRRVRAARAVAVVVESTNGDEAMSQRLEKLVSAAAGGRVSGLRRSFDGSIRAVFGVCVDGAVAPRRVLDVMGKTDWYHLSSPLSASISMEGDAGAPSGQDALALVSAIGLLLWPAGERDRVPAYKCFLRARRMVEAPKPDAPLAVLEAPLHTPGTTRVCLCVPTLSPPSVSDLHELPFVGILVPSFVRSVAASESFRYVVYVGYDEGDPFFDVRATEVWSAVRNLTQGSNVVVHPFRLPPTRGGIAFIWNALMRAAYADGCEYMYQSNDDVEFVSSGWTERFVAALKGSKVAPNFGIVGAQDLNNPIVMTQSCVHRTHQDIFGSHFPHTIKNWHLDDWSSSVYGRDATFHLKDVEIRNTNRFGTRYTECREDERWFQNEVVKFGAKLAEWRRHHT